MSQTDETFFELQCMFICDQVTLEILDVNKAAIEKIGTKKEKIIHRSLNDFVSEPEERIEAKFRAVNSAASHEKIWKLNTLKNQIHFVQFSSQIITFQGRPVKLIVAHDISSLVKGSGKTEQPLSTPVGFQGFPLAEIEWRKTGEILRWSDKAEELFGWTQAELVSDFHLLDNFVHPEDKERVFYSLDEVFASGKKTLSIINRNITKNGQTLHCEWYNSILYNKQGEVVSIYSLVANITDRIEALQRAEKSMRSYRDLFDSISDAIYLLDESGVIIEANQGLERTYGYKPSEVVLKNHSILRAPGKFDNSIIDKILQEKDRKTHKVEGWSKKANGEVFPTEMLINKGNYFGQDVLIIIERDISDRKFAEQELTRRQHLLGELFHTSPLGITLLNSHNEILSVNAGFEKIFGHKMEEVYGLEIDRLIVPKSGYNEAVEVSNSQKVVEREFVRKTKNGDLINVLVYFVPVRIEGKVEAKYAIYLDITERKSTESYIKNSLKEKEVMLAEIHHRVKNNLAVITGLLELQSYATNDSNAQLVLNESRMRVHSIALVHEKLYKNDNLSNIEMHNYVDELVESLKKALNTSQAEHNIHLDIDDINLVITQAIPCGLLINEVITNCYKHAFTNATGGNIWISFKKDGKYLVLVIKDDGVGMETMKNPKIGPSLGMKLIRTLSKQLQAQTEIRVNEGTSYQFRFKKEELSAAEDHFGLDDR